MFSPRPRIQAVDRWRFEGPYEGMSIYTLFSFPIANWMSQGVPTCHWRSHPSQCSMSILSIPGVLLYCSTWCNYRGDPSWPCRCPWSISSVLDHLRGAQHPSRWICTSKAALPCPLLLNGPGFRCSQWPLLVNYGIEAHQGSQATLVTVQPLWSTGSDVAHNPTLG